MPYVKVGRAIRGRDYVKTSLTVGVVERKWMTNICLKTEETLSGLVERLVRAEVDRIQQNEIEAVLAEQGRVAAAHQKSIEAALMTRPERIDLAKAKQALENPAFERNPEAWSDPNEPRLKVIDLEGVMVGEITAKGFRWHRLPPGVKAWDGNPANLVDVSPLPARAFETQPASLKEMVRQAEAIAATLTPEPKKVEP